MRVAPHELVQSPVNASEIPNPVGLLGNPTLSKILLGLLAGLKSSNSLDDLPHISHFNLRDHTVIRNRSKLTVPFCRRCERIGRRPGLRLTKSSHQLVFFRL